MNEVHLDHAWMFCPRTFESIRRSNHGKAVLSFFKVLHISGKSIFSLDFIVLKMDAYIQIKRICNIGTSYGSHPEGSLPWTCNI